MVFPTNNQTSYDVQGNPVMVGIDYRNTSLHNRRGLAHQKQIGRSDIQDLPCHLQHQAGRIAMSTLVSESLKANGARATSFLDPKSTLNTRKDFWVDPKKVRLAKTQRFLDGDKPKKKNQTFNQLLIKYGYI